MGGYGVPKHDKVKINMAKGRLRKKIKINYNYGHI
jgi:hypothetical protein